MIGGRDLDKITVFFSNAFLNQVLWFASSRLVSWELSIWVMFLLWVLMEPRVQGLFSGLAPYVVGFIDVVGMDGFLEVGLVLFPDSFEQDELVSVLQLFLMSIGSGNVFGSWVFDMLRFYLRPILVVKFVNIDVDLYLDVVEALALVPLVAVGSGGVCPCMVCEDGVYSGSFFYVLVNIRLQVRGLGLTRIGCLVDAEIICDLRDLGIVDGVTVLRVDIYVCAQIVWHSFVVESCLSLLRSGMECFILSGYLGIIGGPRVSIKARAYDCFGRSVRAGALNSLLSPPT